MHFFSEDQTKEDRGEFWAPDVPDLRVPGLLTSGTGIGAHLELLGILGGSRRGSQTLGEISGRTETKHWYLADLVDSSRSFGWNECPFSGFRARIAISCGHEIPSAPLPKFNQIALLIPSLMRWGPIRGLGVLEGEVGTHGISLSGPSAKDPAVESELFTVSIGVNPGFSFHSDRTTTINPRTALTFDFKEPADICLVREICWATNSLVSFCTGEINPVIQIEARPDSKSGDGFHQYVALYFSFDERHRVNVGDSGLWHLGINWLQLGGISSIAPWARNASGFKDSIENLIDSQIAVEFDSLFQKLIPRLEPFHKTYCQQLATLVAFDCTRPDDKVTFQERIAHLVACAGAPFEALVVDVGAWEKDVKDLRNNWLHDKRGALRDTVATRDQLNLVESSRTLMTICLIRMCEIDFSHAEPSSIVFQYPIPRAKMAFDRRYGTAK